MAHGEINQIEVPADDPERAMAFYSAVAGWEFSTVEGMPDYRPSAPRPPNETGLFQSEPRG